MIIMIDILKAILGIADESFLPAAVMELVKENERLKARNECLHEFFVKPLIDAQFVVDSEADVNLDDLT